MSELAPHNCHPEHLTAPSRALGTFPEDCAGLELPAQPSGAFTPKLPLTVAAPGQSQFGDDDRGQPKRLTLSNVLFWAGEIIGALSLFVMLFGLLFLAEIFR